MNDLSKLDFQTFFTQYLLAHQNVVTRFLHLAGVILGLVISVTGFFTETATIWILLAAFGVGYSLSWTGHFYFEKNQPLSFVSPLWSLQAYFLMCWKILRTGRFHFEKALRNANGK